MDAAFSPALPLIGSTFGLIFVAELPDKTALASLVLATQYPVRQVIFGAWMAFLVQTLVSVAAGSLLQLLPSQPVRLASGVGFLIFAVIAARRDLAAEEREEAHKVVAVAAARPPWIACFLVVFAAEWGDITQLATAALVAQTRQPVPVALGAIMALWSVTILAAVAGARLGRYLPSNFVKWASVVLFAAVGGAVIISTFTSG
ncbi:MAG TPA: TMEM165/GDT1 family protein [Chloroflexota bacterium]|nr:TMEM165/GDT1 family protein [Chloroflexota bacterium]